MNQLHSFPNAVEAIESVREWLDGEVVPNTTDDLRYHARVARHLLGIVARELASGGSADWFDAQLAQVGAVDEATLAARIADGEWDGHEADLIEVLDRITDERLRVANPAWLAPVIDDDPRR